MNRPNYGGCGEGANPRKMLLHLAPLAGVGGCEINCLRVIEGLAQCDHHVLVFDGRGPMSERWERAGARVDHLSAWEMGRRKFQSAFAVWMESQSQPDGIFYWSTSRLPVVFRALRNWHVPWCVHLGNPVNGGFIRSVQRWTHERRHAASTAVTFVACSHHVAASHRRTFYFRRFSIQVIYNPVAPVFDRPRQYRSLPPGSAPRVGMVARLDSIKDHLTVIRALATTAGVRSDVIVEFAGDGNLRERLEKEAYRLGVAPRVRFLGFTQVGPLLSEWDVYVHSTTPAEGMGTAAAEAMMAGLPCLVSDLEVMREVCGEEGAVYAAAGDATAFGAALVKLIADQAGRKSLGLAAQGRARRLFALPQVADAYRRVIFRDRVKTFA